MPLRAAAAVALCLALALLPAASGTVLYTPKPYTLRVEWTGEHIPVVAPIASVGAYEDKQVGCAGTVQLTFSTGAAVMLVGAALGEETCASGAPPCAPYDALAPAGVSCTSNNLACCTTFVVREPVAGVAELDAGCLAPFWIVTEFHEPYEDAWAGPFYALGPCRGGAS